jgi:AcrR family transcriptional regulator
MTDANEATDRRNAMLKTARELFVEKGFQATSLDMIIARTGGSRRNIYTFFGDKEGLMEAVVQQLIQDVLSRFETLPPVSAPPREWLTSMGEVMLRTLTDPEMVSIFRQFIAVAGERPDLGKDAWSRGPAALHEIVAAYLTHQTSVGTLTVKHPKQAACIFVGMVKGDSQLRALMAGTPLLKQEDSDAQVRLAVDIFLAGTEPKIN